MSMATKAAVSGMGANTSSSSTASNISGNGGGGLDRWIEMLRRCELPSEADIERLCQLATEVFSREETVVKLQMPITIVGDLHGQFYDLLELFCVGGDCPDASYLFLGDYVDRGHYSIETLLLLLALKVRYPSRLTMLRGNHETRQITQVYGFFDECVQKFGSTKVWTLCAGVFDCIPLAALVGGEAFCVHAGLSPSLGCLDDLARLDRKVEVPHEGPMCDLLWSDPDDISGWGVSQRGAGYVFGQDVVNEFNHTNGLNLVCRSHQLVMEGYKEMFDGALVTVWSAPNYCYRCGNEAAILTLDSGGSRSYSVFSASPAELRKKPRGQDSRTTPAPDYFL